MATNQDFQYDVFLSHSAKDKAVVRSLAERLRNDGLKVWFDEWALKPGDSIPAKIEEGLEHSRVLDADVDVHNTSEVLFRLCAKTGPQRDSIFTKGPSDVLDHASSEIASGSKLGIDATKKLPGEGFKRPWPPLIKMDEAVKAKVEKTFWLVGKMKQHQKHHAFL